MEKGGGRCVVLDGLPGGRCFLVNRPGTHSIKVFYWEGLGHTDAASVRRAVSQQAGTKMMVSQREGAWVPSRRVREVPCTQLQTPCPPPRLRVSAVTAGDTYSDKYDFTMR